MYEITLTLITRQLGIELPFEVLKNICRNAIVRVPFSEELIYMKITSLEDIRFREMEWWTPYLISISVDAMSPLTAVEIARFMSYRDMRSRYG